jgi:hypothetical protein
MLFAMSGDLRQAPDTLDPSTAMGAWRLTPKRPSVATARRTHPAVTDPTQFRDFGRYLAAQRSRLGQRVSGCKKIYLDTKYWIYFRDVLVDAPQSEEHRLLFERLIELVRAGKAICPVSDQAIHELFHRRDRPTRMSTAQVMDLLSGGVALEETFQRIRVEALHFVRSQTSGIDVYTRSPNGFGHTRVGCLGLSTRRREVSHQKWSPDCK